MVNDKDMNEKNEKNSNKFDFGKCKICLDNATGIHYGKPTCEACKVNFLKNFLGFLKKNI